MPGYYKEAKCDILRCIDYIINLDCPKHFQKLRKSRHWKKNIKLTRLTLSSVYGYCNFPSSAH